MVRLLVILILAAAVFAMAFERFPKFSGFIERVYGDWQASKPQACVMPGNVPPAE